MTTAKNLSLSVAAALVTALLSAPTFSQPIEPTATPKVMDGICVCDPFNPVGCCLLRK